ncbi:MAG: site-2 protease family protein [Acidobacteriia bacterium]|nr:site-2 protease family protein [Terriglobia bacterium]
MPDLTPELLVFGFLWYIAFLFSTTCHEAAHALAAKLGGDETAALGGQVTLNPLPHIRREPFGMVLVPLLSFVFSGSMMGWASAPFDPSWQRRHPHRAAWMALAGPGANFTLMLLAGIWLRLGVTQHWFHRAVATGGPGLLATILGIFFSLNLLLGTFNLLPVPPLDGSSVVMLFLPESKALRYLDWLRENNFAMLGLVAAFLFFGRIYEYIYGFALHVLYYGLR